jgi:hypothetical protein
VGLVWGNCFAGSAVAMVTLLLVHVLNDLLDCHFHTGSDDGWSPLPNFD